MFGFLKKKRAASGDDREQMIREFGQLMKTVDRLPDGAQLEFSKGLATLWKAFVASYPAKEAFIGKPKKERHSYIKKLTAFEQKTLSGGMHSTALSAAAFKMYVACLSENDAHGDVIAVRLEPFLRRGWN